MNEKQTKAGVERMTSLSSKAALDAFSETLARELEVVPFGVRVHVIAPGDQLSGGDRRHHGTGQDTTATPEQGLSLIESNVFHITVH
jgi:NAD(P)-dependent dehydrogenase (short-subunit alcohol dehydrogenase family)